MPEEMNTKDICVGVALIVFVVAPFALPVRSEYKTSAVFVAKPFVGNSSVSLETLLATESVAVHVYELHTWILYIIINMLGVVEILLLYLRLREVKPESHWSYSSLLDHGGSFLANTEFWLFMPAHHVCICIFALHTASLYGVIALVMAYVLSVCCLCEPSQDCEHNAEKELYTNRVVLIVASVAVTLFLAVMDEQIHSIILDTNNDAWTVFMLQFILDIFLISGHCMGAHLQGAISARLLYVAACNISMVFWFVV
jgi:hypothetical protein